MVYLWAHTLFPLTALGKIPKGENERGPDRMDVWMERDVKWKYIME